jgi:alkyl hydroperoxide reductase subunit D
MINETKENLLNTIGLNTSAIYPVLDSLAATDHKYLRDLRINVSNALQYPNLSKKESYLLALSVAINEKHKALAGSFAKFASAEGATEAELNEVAAEVSLMNINNVFYRFRHFVKKEYYEQTPAGIKMGIMANPVLGKEFFELLSLTISALNGCEMCVNAHEESVLKHGATTARVYDAIRLGAIIKGLMPLI